MANSKLVLWKQFEDNKRCCYCRQNSAELDLYGPIYERGKMIAHYFCILLASNQIQQGRDEEGILGFLEKDMKKEIARGTRLRCTYCGHNGATVGCAVKSCRVTFHMHCGVANMALNLYFDHYESFCKNHRTLQYIPKCRRLKAERILCLVCLEEISSEPSANVCWAPCCKTAWYHKRCIQMVAINAGYYFRCPNCNDNKLFRQRMQEAGIYIPDQDASWEFDPASYSNLNERHNQCDAQICECPKGRNNFSMTGQWRIILCYRCLQKGVHTKCGKSLLVKGQWSCLQQPCLPDVDRQRINQIPQLGFPISNELGCSSSFDAENQKNLEVSLNGETSTSSFKYTLTPYGSSDSQRQTNVQLRKIEIPGNSSTVVRSNPKPEKSRLSNSSVVDYSTSSALENYRFSKTEQCIQTEREFSEFDETYYVGCSCPFTEGPFKKMVFSDQKGCLEPHICSGLQPKKKKSRLSIDVNRTVNSISRQRRSPRKPARNMPKNEILDQGKRNCKAVSYKHFFTKNVPSRAKKINIRIEGNKLYVNNKKCTSKKIKHRTKKLSVMEKIKVNKRCTALNCRCSAGKTYEHLKSKKWILIECVKCKINKVHRFCSKSEIIIGNRQKWTCRHCLKKILSSKNILAQKCKKERQMHTFDNETLLIYPDQLKTLMEFKIVLTEAQLAK